MQLDYCFNIKEQRVFANLMNGQFHQMTNIKAMIFLKLILGSQVGKVVRRGLISTVHSVLFCLKLLLKEGPKHSYFPVADKSYCAVAPKFMEQAK